MKTGEDRIKYFGLNNVSLETELQNIQKKLGIDIGHRSSSLETEVDTTYYPQFSEKTREEAAQMAKHYQILYCLEKSIRELIAQKLLDTAGANWWLDKVPQAIRESAQRSKDKEMESGITLRSNELIDYSTFGQLADIIDNNWDAFDDLFNDRVAVKKILGVLNTLRNPLAHCTFMAEDEVNRLHLSLRDWFRQMS